MKAHVDQLKSVRHEYLTAKKALAAIIGKVDKKGGADRLEMLGFVDGGKSIDWVCEVGGKVINLLCKGSEHHCRIQLKKGAAGTFRSGSKSNTR